MSRLRGLKYAIAALVCIAAFAMLLQVTAQPAAAAPLPGEVFIDVDGDRTYNASVDLGLYPSIQSAIDDASPGDVIVVGSGNYTETLTISIEISLVGANEGIDPNTGVRGNETCLIPNVNALGPLVMLESNHVTIDGFCFNGSNMLLPSYGTINGVNLTMQFFLQNTGGENNFTFVNNIVSTFDTAIELQGESRNNSISANLFDNIQLASQYGQGIHLEIDYFANITYNVFTRTSLAISASSYLTTGSTNIDSNAMSVDWDGIFLNRIGGAGGLWTVSNNVIEAIGSANAGIQVQGVEGDSAGVDLSFNAINAMAYGILLIDNPTTVGVNVIGGTIIDCSYAIYAQEGAIASETADSNYAMDGVTIVNPASYGIYLDDTDSLNSNVTRVNIQNGNTVLGGLNGLGVRGTGAIATLSGAEPLNLTGITDQYIGLIESPRNIDATQVQFEGLIGVNMTLEQGFAVEDKVNHTLDNSALGLVRWTPGELYVTQDSGSIQNAIDVADPGDLVYVDMGNFTEELLVDLDLSIIGSGIDLSNIIAPDTMVSGVIVQIVDGASVNISGFTIKGPSDDLVAGIVVIGGAYAHIFDNAIVNISHDPFDGANVIGVRVGNSGILSYGSALIELNDFTSCQGIAVQVDGVGSSAEINFNTISGDGPSVGDSIVQKGIHVVSFATAYIHNNLIDGIGGLFGGNGIFLEFGAHDVIIENNELVGLGIGADTSTGALLLNGMDGNGFINNSFTLWPTAIYLAGANGTLISNNSLSSNLGEAIIINGASNTTILYNNILDNGGAGILIIADCFIGQAHDNNIVGNLEGAINLDDQVFDARLNWWGHVTGPSGDAQGSGDQIVMSFDDNILYVPWLGIPFPPEVPVNGTFDVLNATHPVTFEGDGQTLVVSMIGTGDHVVALLQYTGNPSGVVYWNDANVYFDFMIFDIAGITQMEMRAYYDPLALPDGIVESDLHAYWSEGGVWKTCSDSGVNLAEDYVWVLLRADTSPSLAQLVGTPFMLGTPVASFAPSVGSAGSLLSALTGAGFNVNQMVTLYLEETPIGHSMTDASGNFSNVSGFIPNVLPGVYGIKVQDASGSTANGQFTVLDTTPIEVTLDVGSLYFPGEAVTWYVMFTIEGVMIDPDTIVATLYGPEAPVIDMSDNLTQLTTGLWIITGIMPGDASSGEYTMVVRANISTSNFGATLRTFLISATLMDQYSLIVSIDDDIARIQTRIGTILIDLSEISANLIAIEGSLATIQTSIGLLQVDIDLINANLAWANGTLVTVQTTLGNITVQLDEIYTQIEGIQGDIAVVNTTLGLVQVTVEAIHALVFEINGTVVTVRTDIGTLQTSVTSVNAHLTAVENDVATVQTTVGTITVNLTALNTKVTSIQGNVATIWTSLGTLTGNVTAIEGDIVTIQTNLGTMQTDITGLQLSAVDNGNIGLMSIVMLMMVLFILVAMYFWRLRKVL